MTHTTIPLVETTSHAKSQSVEPNGQLSTPNGRDTANEWRCASVAAYGIVMACAQQNLKPMLRWVLIFAVIAIIAGAFGFTGIAAGAAGIAKVIFFIFLALIVLAFVFGGMIWKKVK